MTSNSTDSGGTYLYGSATWEPMRASAGNSVKVVDGLGQMQISAQMIDKLANASGTRTADIAITLNPPGVGVPAPLTPIVQAASTTQASYNLSFSNAPIKGLWIAQALDAALGTGTFSAVFGGSGYQQLSVQVSD